MSNIKDVVVPASSDYQSLATILDEILVANTTYTIQATGDIIVCESSTKPTSGGFFIPAKKAFQFTYTSDGLWIKKAMKDSMVRINVAD